MDNQSSIASLWERLKEFITLKYEYTRLTLAEKLSLLLAVIAMCLIALVGISIALFFLSMALSHFLGGVLGPVWSAVIVAGIYIVLLLVIFALRKQLIVNPISRFVSRLFF